MRKILLYSSALVVLSGTANAACIQTPSCSSLGYSSSSSCSGGTKCPWGNYWNCDAINKINSLNTQITNLTNKITEQTNTITNLETQITEIRKEVTTSNCLVGDILYSDMTTSPDYVSGKTPIGVVFDCRKKLAIGLEESQKYWSRENFWAPGYISTTELVKRDLDGKKNTSTVLAYCKANGYSCPAFEYVNSYKTEGTSAGDWYLPAVGELNAIWGYVDVLNMTLSKINSGRLSGYYWSSNSKSSVGAWDFDFSDGNLFYEFEKSKDNNYVRPVLAF